MANIATLKEAVLLCKQANVTPWIWGHRGLGKSSLVRQICEDGSMGFIDFRASQIEASDLRGLPDRVEGRTTFLPPADMPWGDMSNDQIAKKLGPVYKDGDLDGERAFKQRLRELQPHFQHGILFLDELNRAPDDVLQAVFQLVLDRAVGQYTLPPGWVVVVAGNYSEGYQVNSFNDPAFLDRFCHMTLSAGEPTLEEWIAYMATVHGGHASEVIEFASQNVKHLDGEVVGELGFAIQPSRRSWDAVARVTAVTAKAKYSKEAAMEVLSGLIGRELATSFSRYNCPVKPRDLLDRGVKANEKALGKLSRGQMVGLMWGLVSFCRERIEDDKVAAVCLDYAEWMCGHAPEKDLVVAFCRAMVTSGNSTDPNEKARVAVVSNPRLARMLADFNKKAGGKQSFIDRLASRPQLQTILSKVAWGDRDD